MRSRPVPGGADRLDEFFVIAYGVRGHAELKSLDEEADLLEDARMAQAIARQDPTDLCLACANGGRDLRLRDSSLLANLSSA